MRVRVLGCHGGETPHHRTTCFLIDERITIDAGALCRTLSLEDQARIDHILVSHSHMDHVKDLALLADQVIGRRTRPVSLHCGPETAETLRSSYFNNFLWPDFTRIPTSDAPVMQIVEHEPLVPFWIRSAASPADAGSPDAGSPDAGSPDAGSPDAGSPDAGSPDAGSPDVPAEGDYQVTYVPVSHPVESMAMLIRGPGGTILYSSDTGPTHQLWEVANACRDLLGMFVELSFPNQMQALADVSGHYTPNTLAKEMSKVDGRPEVPLYIYHLKPSFYQQTRDELLALGLPNVHLVELTDEFQF